MGIELPAPEQIPLGISSCLLGNAVRFDGGHKRDNYILGTLSCYFDFRPLCPEMAIGLPVPRPPIRLVKHASGVRVVGVADKGLDVTEQLQDYGKRMAAELDDICGFIFKRGSPSCGMERVRIYDGGSRIIDKGAGAFAAEFMRARPLLPIEEEGRLGDPGLRENFILRIFVCHRWRRMRAAGLSAKALIDFHSDHKYLLLAHNQIAYRRMGRLLASFDQGPLEVIAENYLRELMLALAKPASRQRHVNVLQHLLSHLKRALDAADKAELVELIEEYRLGRIPLIVPIIMLRHHFRRHPQKYIERQIYLSPHPSELMLRSRI